KFARDRILVEDALGRRPMQLGLGELKRRLGRHPVAGFDRGLDPLDEGAHPAHAGPVDGRALFGLAKPFFGGFMMRHRRSLETRRAGLYRCRDRASTAWSGLPDPGRREKADLILPPPARSRFHCWSARMPPRPIAAA